MEPSLWEEDYRMDGPEEEPDIYEGTPEFEAEPAEAIEEERVARAYDSIDPRDFTPEPPAYLDIHSLLRMRAMVKDAGENGDRPWPYTRDAA